MNITKSNVYISKKLNYYYIELSLNNTKSRRNRNLQRYKLHCNSNISSQNTEKLSSWYWLFGWWVHKGSERQKEGGEVNTLY